MRFTHYIRPNERLEIPHHILVVDTETNIKVGSHEFLQEQTFRLGFAIYLRYDSRTKKYFETEYPFNSLDDFFNILDDLVKLKKKLFIFAHNASFDYAILKMDTYFSTRNFKVKMRVIDSVFIIKASVFKTEITVNKHMKEKQIEKVQTTIVFSDTMNYYRMSLEKLGKIFGSKKMDKPDFHNVTDTDLMVYCKQDVRVLTDILLKHIEFISENDLGNFKLTIASQAFTAFTHRFMKEKILVHTHEDILNLELKSYRGGRCEAFKLGKYTDIFKLDINSMYPYVMKEHPYPTIPISTNCVSGVTVSEIESEIKNGSYVLAECKLKLYKPAIAIKKDKLLFPIGNVIQTLTSPEIEYLIKNPEIGEIVSVEQCCLYKQAKLFSEYVDFFYNFRLTTTNDAYKEMSKLFMNSLYGKLAQREISKHSEVKDENIRDMICSEMNDLNTNTIIDIDENGKSKKYLRMSEMLYCIEKQNDQLARDSSPVIASSVTGHARTMLFDVMYKIGFENIYYCDTDSIFTNEYGYNVLKESGLISQTELGKLKLEETGSCEIFGAKNYHFNDSVKLKGIKKDAIKVCSDCKVEVISGICPECGNKWKNSYQQAQFLTKNLRYRKDIPDGLVLVHPVTKKISLNYDKGIIRDNEIFPLEFQDF